MHFREDEFDALVLMKSLLEVQINCFRFFLRNLSSKAFNNDRKRSVNVET